jgi:hypothetical protein
VNNKVKSERGYGKTMEQRTGEEQLVEKIGRKQDDVEKEMYKRRNEDRIRGCIEKFPD